MLVSLDLCFLRKDYLCLVDWVFAGRGKVLAEGCSMRRYIASDFHNGNDVADYDRVMGFLELVEEDADKFLILGDFEELLWSNMTILTRVKPYSYVTEKVRAIARKKPVSYVIGNHDWNVGLFKSCVEPAKIVSPFARNGVYYTHGHEWDWVSLITGTPVDPIYWKNPFPFLFPTQFFLWLATRVWTKSEDTYFWGIALIHERARAYAAEHGYHTVVFGHTHYPAEELRGGIKLYNTGDMMDSYSYLVEEGGVLELKYF